MRWDSSKNERDAMQCIVNLTILLGHLRREGGAFYNDRIVALDETEERSYTYFAGEMEDVERAGNVLTNLARGHALITGRNYITIQDIPVVIKTVLSTARMQRVKSFIALLDYDGEITVVQLSRLLNISHSSATRLAVELKAIGLVNTQVTNNIEFTKNNNPTMQTVISLDRNKFEWFLSDEFKRLRDEFTPVDNRKYIHEQDPEHQAAKEAEAATTTATTQTRQ
jgi:hypothetical protein